MKQKLIGELIGTVARLAGEDADAQRLLATISMLDGMGGGGAEMLVLREALNGRALHLAGPEHFREKTKPMPVIYLGTILDDKVLFTTQTEDAAASVKASDARPWRNVFTDPPTEGGMYEVVCATDDGPLVLILERNRKGHWIINGEETFCQSYYINVRLWRERAAAPAELPEDPDA